MYVGTSLFGLSLFCFMLAESFRVTFLRFRKMYVPVYSLQIDRSIWIIFTTVVRIWQCHYDLIIVGILLCRVDLLESDTWTSLGKLQDPLQVSDLLCQHHVCTKISPTMWPIFFSNSEFANNCARKYKGFMRKYKFNSLN